MSNHSTANAVPLSFQERLCSTATLMAPLKGELAQSA